MRHLRRLLSIILAALAVGILTATVAFAQEAATAIPTDPLAPDVKQLLDLAKALVAAVGTGKALGVLGAVLAGIAFLLRYSIAIWRMSWIQSRLPDRLKWDSWGKLKQVGAVFGVTFLSLFLGSLIAVGWKAALIAAVSAVVPTAFAAMGVHAATKTASAAPAANPTA